MDILKSISGQCHFVAYLNYAVNGLSSKPLMRDLTILDNRIELFLYKQIFHVNEICLDRMETNRF
jgi:hypothetical protein